MVKVAGTPDTPMMAQYQAAKRQQPDALLFFRMGDFYEMFFEDAKEAARLLNITLTARSKGENAVPMAGVPVRSAHHYIARLVRAGKRVAICEQLTDPKQSKGLVERDIVRIVTAGTLTEDELLDGRAPNFLAACCLGEACAGLAWLDLSTGGFLITQCAPDKLEDELSRLDPAEILVPEGAEPGLVAQRAPVRRCPPYDFHPAEAEKELNRFFGTHGLEGFGVDPAAMPAAVAAAGALIRYAQETQRGALPHVRRIEVFARGSRMLLDRATRASLELVRTQREGQKEGSLLAVIDRTRTPMGARLLRERVLAPFVDLADIGRVQQAVAECHDERGLRQGLRDTLGRVQDLERLVARLACGRAHARDLKALEASMRALPALRAALAGATSELLAATLSDLDPLEDLALSIAARIVDEPPLPLKDGGLIRDGFDRELDELRSIGRDGKAWMARFEAEEMARSGIQSLRVGFNRVFGYYVEVSRSADLGKLPATWTRKQTVRNAERYVTPELQALETKVLRSEELAKEREYALFSALRDELARNLGRILDSARQVAELDVVAALAELAQERVWCRPQLGPGRELVLEAARHPVLEATLQGEPFVPNDTDLDPPHTSLVVLTGPNMAGKSTWIRQNALLVLLAQIGSYVPARAARLGLVDRVFTRVGAADDIARGSSTFMVEMTETANILNNASERSLVILDEVGRGTSTYDGLALAWAICEALAAKGCRTLFATHYHQMTELGELLPGIVNCHVAVREWQDEIVFLHHIEPGGTDKSYGLQVARLAGLPGDILARASALLAKLEEEGERSRPALAPPAGKRGRQLELFRPPADRLLDELQKIDVDRLTPVDALLRLKELRERYKG